MAQPEAPGDPDPSGAELSRLDSLLAPLFTDAALRPLLLVVGASLVTFGTGLVLLAARSRNRFAALTVVLLIIASVESIQRDLRRRSFGPRARLVVGFWAATGMCAGAIVWMGWY